MESQSQVNTGYQAPAPIGDVRPALMQFEKIGGFNIYRPRLEREHVLRVEGEAHLRSRFRQGVYTDRQSIDEILKHHINFYGSKFDSLIVPLASRDFLDFILFQYDEASKIDQLHQQGKLSAQDYERWSNLGHFQRAIKYMAERCIMLTPSELPEVKDEQFLTKLDDIWICAEQLISYCISSDVTVLMEGVPVLQTIYPPGETNYALFEIEPQFRIDLSARWPRDGRNRHKFFSSPAFEDDVNLHEEIIGSIFEQKVGVSYKTALSIIKTMLDRCIPARGKHFPTLFCHRSKIIEGLAKTFCCDPKSVALVLDGFTVTKENLIKEGRNYWSPKFHHRAYRRGAFLMPHSTGDHLSWSSEMASEGLVLLANSVPFVYCPEEWKDEKLTKELTVLNRKGTKWFEKEVARNMTSLGIMGNPSQPNHLGTGAKRILLGAGEFDFIGYSQREHLLVLLECKMVYSGKEARWWRSEITDFVGKSDSYANKFRTKIAWIRDNSQQICDALRSLGLTIEKNPSLLATAMITYWPSVTKYLINDFPCVSLTELMLDYEDSTSWPYDKGIYGLV